MSQIREIKNRITSVKKTQQITRAMKMIAGVKFRKADSHLVAVRPYARLMQSVVSDVAVRNTEMRNLYFRKTKMTKNKDLLIVVTGDRGLCGNYNSAVIRKVQEMLRSDRKYDLILIGKKGRLIFKKPGNSVVYDCDNPGHDVGEDFLKDVSIKLVELYPNYDRVSFVCTEFVNAVQRNVDLRRLFPICDQARESEKQAELLYEMDEEAVLEDLIMSYTQSSLRYALVESAVSEESARMTAMDSATNNANDMIRSLTLVYNRVRQAGITKEIIEISSGAEALAQT